MKILIISSFLVVAILNSNVSFAGYKQLTSVTFNNPSQSWETLSLDEKTLTTRLPPSESIQANSPQLRAKVEYTFSGSGDYDGLVGELATGVPGFPFSMRNKITCGYSAATQGGGVHCNISRTAARTLTDEVSIPIRFKPAHSNRSFMLTWIIKPTLGGPWVKSLNTPQVTMGNLTSMEVILTAPAPPGGTQVNWQLLDGRCFSYVANGDMYGANGWNNFTILQGHTSKTIQVRSNSTCGSPSVNTTVTLNTEIGGITRDYGPYRVKSTFLLKKPPLYGGSGSSANSSGRTTAPSNNQSRLKPVGRLKKKPSSKAATTNSSNKLQVTGANVRSVTLKPGAQSSIQLRGGNLQRLKSARVLLNRKVLSGVTAQVVKKGKAVKVVMQASRNVKNTKNLQLEVSDGRRYYRVPIAVSVAVSLSNATKTGVKKAVKTTQNRAKPLANVKRKTNTPTTSRRVVKVTGANVRSAIVKRNGQYTIELKGSNLLGLKSARILRGVKLYPGVSAKLVKRGGVVKVVIKAARNSRAIKNLKLEVNDGKRNYSVPVKVHVI